MLKGALARRYAQALFELASNTSLEQMENELLAFSGMIESEPEIKNVLQHPHISLTDKKAIITKLTENASLSVRNFLNLLIDRRRQDLLPLIVREFIRLADEARQIAEVRVTSAIALKPEHEEQLKKAISRLTGKQVRMKSEVNPDLIGGVRVQVGDQVFDGSVLHSLNRMREELRRASEKPQEAGVN